MEILNLEVEKFIDALKKCPLWVTVKIINGSDSIVYGSPFVVNFRHYDEIWV